MCLRSAVRYARHIALVIVVVVAFIAVRWGQQDESPTTDEWAHFTRGVAYVQTGDPRLSYAHPPLANVWAALPVAGDPRLPDVTQLEPWSSSMDAGLTSLRILRHDYEAAREDLMRARRQMVWFLVLGIVYVYCFVHRLAGWYAAVAAAVFVGWNPTVVAQARYVTTDLPAAVTIGIAVGELVRAVTSARMRWARVTVPVTIGVALLTKHTAVVLPLLSFGVVAAMAALGRGRYRIDSRRLRWGRVSADVFVSAVVVLLIVNAGYRFQGAGDRVGDILERPEPQYWISAPYEGRLLDDLSPLGVLPAAIPWPLPYAYTFGVTCIRAQTQRGYPRGTFRGEPAPYGHAAYFPLMLLFKTPLALLVSLVGGVFLLVRKIREPSSVSLLVAITAALLVPLVFTRLNMGVRHALPQILLLGVLAGIAVASVCARLRNAQWRGVVLTVVVGWSGITLVRAGPRYLGWFNPLISRSDGLAISAAGDDWGQDVAAFAARANQESWFPLVYHDPGNTKRHELAHHLDRRFRRLRCRTKGLPRRESYAVVHLHELQIADAYPRRRCFTWRPNAQLVDIVNDHIYVYKIMPAPRRRRVGN